MSVQNIARSPILRGKAQPRSLTCQPHMNRSTFIPLTTPFHFRARRTLQSTADVQLAYCNSGTSPSQNAITGEIDPDRNL